MTWYTDPTRCVNCNRKLTPPNGRREYCNAACKQQAYRTRKGAVPRVDHAKQGRHRTSTRPAGKR